MLRRKLALYTAAIVTMALLIGLSGYPAGLQAQDDTCDGVLVCREEFNPATGSYYQVCQCCTEEGTPAGTPIVTTLQPPPTATPLPENHFVVCVREDCPPNEMRLTHLVHDPVMGTLFVAEYLEECCGPSCPCGQVEEPCEPGSGWIHCSEFEASVQAGLPIWHADREPYPRALVTLPVELWVSDAAGNLTTALPSTEAWGDPVDPGDDACDEDEPPVGTVCDYRLGLRVEPGSEPPTWHIEDCGTTTGWRASCPGWTRSSWGKPELGVGMAPDCPQLPAYTVRATVPYWWSLGRQWEQWEEDCECVCQGFPGSNECSGAPGHCTGEGEHWEEDCDGDWKHHGPDWVLLDLTLYGWPTPYMLNPNVQLVAHPPCELAPPVGALYIPCIEVQAPIEKQP